MQNMHKTTHGRSLTGVHWPIYRGKCRGSGAQGEPEYRQCVLFRAQRSGVDDYGYSPHHYEGS